MGKFVRRVVWQTAIFRTAERSNRSFWRLGKWLYSASFWKFILNFKLRAHSLIRSHPLRHQISQKLFRISENFELEVGVILEEAFTNKEVETLMTLATPEISYLSATREFYVFMTHYFEFIWYSNDWDPFYVIFLDICETLTSADLKLTSAAVDKLVLDKIDGFVLRDYFGQRFAAYDWSEREFLRKVVERTDAKAKDLLIAFDLRKYFAQNALSKSYNRLVSAREKLSKTYGN